MTNANKSRSALPDSLRKILREASDCVIAFSGGLDSRFLAYSALLCDLKPLLVHANGPHIPEDDAIFAKKWAKEQGLDYIEISYNPFESEEVAKGSRLRCYGCKKLLLGKIRKTLAEIGAGERAIWDGTNADDLKQYRPGLTALEEEGAISPLADAGLGKKEIRSFAKSAGLDWPEQRARPCLLTRWNYGSPPDPSLFAKLQQAETSLEKLLQNSGVSNLRLRFLPEPELHLQADATLKPELSRQIGQTLKALGFSDLPVRTMKTLSGFFDVQELSAKSS